MKIARRKLEIPMPVAMPCRLQHHQHRQKFVAQLDQHKTKNGCVVEATESMKIRMEGSQSKKTWIHWVTAISCTNFFLWLQARIIPDARKIEELQAWQLTKVRNKSEVIAEARHEGREELISSVMEICHLKNSELEPKDQSRIQQFGKKVLPGLFLGYAFVRGGNLERWRTDCRPWGSWKRWTHRKSTRKDSMWKRWYFPKKENLLLQSQMDESKHLEEIRNWEHPLWYGIDQFKEESNIDFLGEPEGSPPPQPHDSLPDAGEALNDFWSISGNFIYRHHVEPRVKLYSPREESFPIPLKYIDVSRTTHTNLDVKQEKHIDDYWNIDGSRDLSDPWTGFTQFTLLDEKAPDGYVWSGGEINEKTAYIQIIHGQSSGNQWEECEAKGKAKVVWREAPSWKRTTIARGSISSTRRIRNSKKPSRTRVRSWKHQWLLPCPVKLWKIVEWCIQQNQDKTCVYSGSWWINKTAYGKFIAKSSWRPYCRKRRQFITALQCGSQIYSYASSYENSGSKSSGGQGMGKNGEIFGVEPDESQK